MPAPMIAYFTPDGTAIAVSCLLDFQRRWARTGLTELLDDLDPVLGIMIHKSRPIANQFLPIRTNCGPLQPTDHAATTSCSRRNGSDGEAEDPQLVANRGANSITSRLRRAIETGVYSRWRPVAAGAPTGGRLRHGTLDHPQGARPAGAEGLGGAPRRIRDIRQLCGPGAGCDGGRDRPHLAIAAHRSALRHRAVI